MGIPQGKSFYRRPLPVTLSDLQSPEGRALFQAALSQGEAEAFFPLISHLQTQSHPALCGLTTLSTILNALSIDPLRVWAHPWRWYAENLLDCCVPLQEVMEKGITVDELACTAVCEGVDVTVHRGFDISQARKLIRRSVRNPTDGTFQFLAVSFHRARLGQTGTGHFSPIAAYESESDSVLILDVARFKYAPYWVPLKDLLEATQPLDTATGLSRGFLVFRKIPAEDSKRSTEPCINPGCSGKNPSCSILAKS